MRRLIEHCLVQLQVLGWRVCALHIWCTAQSITGCAEAAVDPYRWTRQEERVAAHDLHHLDQQLVGEGLSGTLACPARHT